MKYHYQFVSKTTVRIELIPEDKKDIQLIQSLAQAPEDEEQLTQLFKKGLSAYSTGTMLTKTKFMNFPTVALCNFIEAVETIDNVA